MSSSPAAITSSEARHIEARTVLNDVKHDEGFKRFPYRDSKGIESIGYGFNLHDVGLSEMEAEAVLAMRLSAVCSALAGRFPWVNNLSEPRRAVLQNQAYNLGVHGLANFDTYLELVRLGRYEEAAADDMHTAWARQVGNRAKRLCEQMRTGEWQPLETAPPRSS